ncbi:unnamed protein product [Microthlaspi erraticum]|uniref:Uncharacterized protein n=1 Tax=Microthlaspi erraticum TaxID=1685480 RepID=A0A6D2ILB9_9BRAS|nr:unnamed protein product [Microthlaspi erraticum]
MGRIDGIRSGDETGDQVLKRGFRTVKAFSQEVRLGKGLNRETAVCGQARPGWVVSKFAMKAQFMCPELEGTKYSS